MSWIDDITDMVYRRVPELEEQEELCEDLISDAFYAIMNYSKANSYEKKWDRTLVRCVAMLYNTIGAEGSTYRSSLDTIDTYDASDILASFIQANVQQYLRPSGYTFSETRFNYPD